MKLRVLVIFGVLVLAAALMWPRLGGLSGANSVRLGTAIIYDESGREIGRVKPSLLGGSFIASPDGGDTGDYATVEVTYQIWLYDQDVAPGDADIVIDFYKAGLVPGVTMPSNDGGDVTPESETRVQNAIRQVIKGTWSYQGTNYREGGKDWMTSGTTKIKVTAQDLVDVFGMKGGQTASFAAFVKVTAGSLTASARSSNTVSFKLAESKYSPELVIQRVTVGA